MPETAPDQPSVIRPPFRAVHVGSLLRPPELLQPRADDPLGGVARVQDDAIRAAFQ